MNEKEDFSSLSPEELIAKIQEAGRGIDQLQALKRSLTDEFDKKMAAVAIRQKHGEDLSDEAVEQIDAIVKASRISSSTEAKSPPEVVS